MNTWQLILRNLQHYRKLYFSTLLGIAISTAILTGALIVGDSVRFSLQNLTESRLGNIRLAIHGNDRVFRQTLADSLQNKLPFKVCPILQIEGIAVNPDKKNRINRVGVIGMDKRFGDAWSISFQQPATDEAIISKNTAEKLQLKTGEEFVLRLEKKEKAPRNAPFVAMKSPSVTMRMKVIAIADENMGRFSLQSNQVAPYSIFISLDFLSRKLGINGYANTLLFEGKESAGLTTGIIDSTISNSWTLADAGIYASQISPGTYQITSERIFMGPDIEEALKYAVPNHQSFLTYLVNSISLNGKSTPYSFVTAALPQYLDQSLTGNEIILNSWLAGDLEAQTGDSLMLRYFTMGTGRSLKEDSCRFVVRSIIDIHSDIFDRSLMPDFPGMSDAGNCHEWETGAPIDMKKIRDKDESYWNEFRGTPKAFIPLATGQEIWKNAFGLYTAFHFNADSSSIHGIEKKIISLLSPAANGFRVDDVRKQGLQAATDSTDFGSLFLSLSFFIILSGLLLTALIFGLHANKRIPETAILVTLGFKPMKIASILFIESLMVSFLGSIPGAMLGIAYNKLLIWGLNSVWMDAVGTSMLQMHVETSTLLIGAGIGMITSLLTIVMVLLMNLRKQPSQAVKGNLALDKPGSRIRILIIKSIAVFCLSISLILILIPLIKPGVGNSEMSLISGGLMMPGLIGLLAICMYGGTPSSNKLPSGFKSLVFNNIKFRRKRTLSAITLLALGTFSIIITGVNRKSFATDEENKMSGTGGFLLWTESTLPIPGELNSRDDQPKIDLADDPLLSRLNFIHLPKVDGDDASCLNLNQVTFPAILGIPADLFESRKSFRFDQLDPSVDPDTPWLALEHEMVHGVIAGFADQTVIDWGIRKKIGDTLLYHDEAGNKLKIKLLGGLQNSIFQGYLLISDKFAHQYFPATAKSSLMLVDGPFSQQKEVARILESQFSDIGMLATPPSQRLESFNAVENTYLSVFMVLGGLGVIIGVFGLGILLLRNTHDRKKEMAIYQAIGFNRQLIFKIVVYEYFFILITGISIGLISALIGILPSINTSFTQLPWIQLLAILGLIIISGGLWIYFPARIAMKNNPINSLREE